MEPEPYDKMMDDKATEEEGWVCGRCGKRGGFKLLGGGLVKCEGCGALHFVTNSGELIYLPNPLEEVK